MTPRIVFVGHEASFMSTMETGEFLSYDRGVNKLLDQAVDDLIERISPPGFSI